MSFPDRFDLLEPLREDDQQTFRACERATGRIVEVHFLASEMNRPPQQIDVIEQGDHEGKRYVVTAPLDSAGAWRIRPAAVPPEPPTESKAEPGDFTRMFELRQAPEPAPLPAAKPVPAPASQPGEFTRAFQRPAAAPVSAPEGASAPGQAGDFTRMFQTPKPQTVPEAPVERSDSSEPLAEPARNRTMLVMAAILLLCAIAVFVLVRLY